MTKLRIALRFMGRLVGSVLGSVVALFLAIGRGTARMRRVNERHRDIAHESKTRQPDIDL